jgi:hypothetical protein
MSDGFDYQSSHPPSADEESWITYRIETAYLTGERPLPPNQETGRAIAIIVARWANAYEAWPVGEPALVRRGSLPDDSDARGQIIAEVIDHLEAWLANNWATAAIGLVGLRLYQADRKLLDQSDGFPAVLNLTQAQFLDLRDDLERADLPDDLYYSEREVRRVIAPYEVYGGLVLGEMAYSPLEWGRRGAAAVASLRVPSEEERRQTLFEECLRFSRALIRRTAELREPGKTPDQEELDEIAALQRQIGTLLARLRPAGSAEKG